MFQTTLPENPKGQGGQGTAWAVVPLDKKKQGFYSTGWQWSGRFGRDEGLWNLSKMSLLVLREWGCWDDFAIVMDWVIRPSPTFSTIRAGFTVEVAVRTGSQVAVRLLEVGWWSKCFHEGLPDWTYDPYFLGLISKPSWNLFFVSVLILKMETTVESTKCKYM
jgi:hypothetical protein